MLIAKNWFLEEIIFLYQLLYSYTKVCIQPDSKRTQTIPQFSFDVIVTSETLTTKSTRFYAMAHAD